MAGASTTPKRQGSEALGAIAVVLAGLFLALYYGGCALFINLLLLLTLTMTTDSTFVPEEYLGLRGATAPSLGEAAAARSEAKD